MAVSTDIKTPLTLVKDQDLSIIDGKNEITCFNDSKLSQAHYRTIPNNESNEGRIKWANIASVLLADGDYAIAVSMSEYIYTGGGVMKALLLNTLPIRATNGDLITDSDNHQYYIQPNTIKDENPRVSFRKIVWVRASDLVLGSVAQQQAIKDKAAKEQQDYIDSLTKTPPVTGNANPGGTTKVSSTVWIIIGFLLLLIGGIWALIAGKKKKDKAKEADKMANGGSNVNIIRIPKNT